MRSLRAEPSRTAPPLQKGQRFNESIAFADKLTGRASRQLTQFRQFNDQPTYHLNAGFSADSRHLILTTRAADGSSALLRAEVAAGEITVVATLPPGERFGMIAMVQATGWIVANLGTSLRLYHPVSLEERVLVRDAVGLNCAAPSVDGRRIFFTRGAPEVTLEGKTFRPAIHCEVDIATGAVREIFAETEARTSHAVVCPTDSNLLLIDRDRSPKFGGGGDGRTSRVWILDVRTARLTEIRPRDANRFQIHSNWSHCGQFVYYHGTSLKHSFPTSPHGHYIGVADRAGQVVWEGHFPTFFYGHVSTHTKTHAIVTDALLTGNLITAVHWRERNAQEIPRIEILAQHDTQWVIGRNAQSSHPHPHVSPDGKWLSYNRGGDGRSDVCVVQL